MTITIWGSICMVVAHVYQICTPDCDRCWMSLGPLILLGLSYTAYAVVLWGSLPYMVEARVLGTAFGICTTFQNLGTVIAPPIIGLIQSKTPEIQHGYGYVEVFFIGVSTLALALNIGVYAYDKKKRLNLLQSV
jgi:MFS family permease